MLLFILLSLQQPLAHASPENMRQEIPAPRAPKIKTNGDTAKAPPKTTPKACATLDLFEIAKGRQTNCLKTAIQNMDVNDSDENGETPLHVAIRAKNRAAINFFLSHGADLNARNFELRTPREVAEELGFNKLARYLQDKEIETERLVYALEAGDYKGALGALKRGASVGTRNTRKDTPLHKAAQSNLPEMAKLLIQAGADPNSRNYLGETPLHAAAYRDFVDVMKALLEAKADPNALNHRRETPYDFAFVNQDPRILALFGKYKARRGSRADISLEISGGDGEAPSTSAAAETFN